MTATQGTPAPPRRGPRHAAPEAPAGRLAALAGMATPLRVAGGVLTILGTYLPWATFVLNEGAYPAQATLEFFTVPFGVTGFRLHLLLFGIAAIVLALVSVPGRVRILRAIGWGVVAVSVVNGLWIAVSGGGLGAITAADGGIAFGAFVALVGGVLLLVGAAAGGLEPTPVWEWRLNPWLERGLLLVVFALLLLLVSAVLTSGGQGSAANVYAGAVFLSFLGAVGGLLAALHASGLLTWVGVVSERHRVFSVLVLLACALLLPLTGAGTEYWMTVAANIGVYAATAIGLNIVVGLAGLLDLGYVAFLGIGAFVAANFSGATAAQFGIALPFPLVMVISAVVAGIFGAIVGSPTLRVRGDYLAIVTLAFGEIFVRSAQNNIGGLTGGSNAIPGIPPVSLFGTAFNDEITIGALELPPGVLYYVLIVLIVAAVMLVFANLKNSRLGRAWIAIREDEDAARAMGVRTGPIKILAFLIGAMLAGLAGAFFAHKTATVSYESFRFLESVTLLAAVILGGMGTIPGAVLGASILFVLPEKLREFADYRLLLFGLALILIMRFRPQGLVPDAHRRAELAPETVEDIPTAAIPVVPAEGRK
ncbi:branched-chain amino acid ABC transporter permease [Pseudonocardia kunmingensis]|uniref:Amino acid/amide ABC transporter membrane protein 2 (HAAT family) n=1 Tax=Pseudonocardia kunmingensis TaxID=630975 RepID=A0A543DW64_9PSEU|nr:branched-chain amino acid ABC transporter permease [Pseudonocardia kunmingensis]TQM13555.1 amino acid/amide ABC transporter membrane protein 2 (HAAT family) [Pseudonocardia kunmingensis]